MKGIKKIVVVLLALLTCLLLVACSKDEQYTYDSVYVKLAKDWVYDNDGGFNNEKLGAEITLYDEECTQEEWDDLVEQCKGAFEVFNGFKTNDLDGFYVKDTEYVEETYYFVVFDDVEERYYEFDFFNTELKEAEKIIKTVKRIK